MNRLRGTILILTTLVVGFVAGTAHAAAPVEVTVTPLLGTEAPAPPGWFGYSVRIRGIASRVQGTVELTDGTNGAPRAAFSVRAGDQAVLELYAHDVFSRTLEAVARDADGEILAKAHVDNPKTEGPLLFDAGGQNKLAVALKDEKIATAVSPHAWAPPESLLLSVSRASADPRSGELVLPERAAGYGAATVVLMRSEVLVGLPQKAMDALSDWILAGGELAIPVGRTEDLGHARLTRFIGAGVHQAPATRAAESTDFTVMEAPDPDTSETKYGVRHVRASDKVTTSLVGFTGGVLAPTRYGSRARVGLGAVHLLAFDPNAATFIDDEWARRTVVDLVRQAWDARSRVALVANATGFDENRLEMTRRHMDPNESGRWSVVVAAAILFLYAIIAGPLTFRRATRSGKPLRALVELPLWSLGALSLVVGIGAISKGGRARARRLAVVECGSGAERCAALRLRAFFASSADTLHVEATEPAALLEVAGAARSMPRTLVLDRGNARLEDLRGRPWETVLVREDGFEGLNGKVTLQKRGTDYELHNGMTRALVGIIAQDRGGPIVSFKRVEPGKAVLLSKGEVVTTPSPPPVVGGASPGVEQPHRLEAYRFSSHSNTDVPGLGSAWEALEYAAADSIDWWPKDTAVVLAEIEGASGLSTDSDLLIDKDRLLLRLLGDEGTP